MSKEQRLDRIKVSEASALPVTLRPTEDKRRTEWILADL